MRPTSRPSPSPELPRRGPARRIHCTAALLLLLSAGGSGQQVLPTSTAYTIFLRGVPIGREDVSVSADATGTTVVSEGRVSAADLVIRRAEFRFGADGTANSFSLDASLSGTDLLLRTTVNEGTAATEGRQAGQPVSLAHPISAGAVIHANGVFASYVGLARRLATTKAGSEVRLYVVPQAEITARVVAVHEERMQLGADFLDVRRYELVFVNPGGEIAAQLTADRDGRLIGVSVPAQAVAVVRADAAASTTRTRVHSNPGDEPVTIPAAGFNLGATLTRPSGTAAAAGSSGRSGSGTQAGRLPAVILVNGSGADDRDGFGLGAPIMGQLAGALADAGFASVRYDKRGHGQSGGRVESVTISDAADDVRAVMRWLSARKDIDPKRIAILGHADGAWVAFLAAAREKKFAAVVSIAGPAGTGAERLLEQQQQALDLLPLTPAERERRVALQKQIQAAVLTGKGWDALPASVRKQADTPWLQSVLAFDPAKVIEDVRQPLLFVHGALDLMVPASHADRLAELARKESDSKSIDVVLVRGVDHLLAAAPPETGGAATQTGRTISGEPVSAVATWLARTFAAVR